MQRKNLHVAESPILILESHNYSVYILVSDNNNVELCWGNALTYHWGIRISDNSLEIDRYDHEFMLIEPNIALFITD